MWKLLGVSYCLYCSLFGADRTAGDLFYGISAPLRSSGPYHIPPFYERFSKLQLIGNLPLLYDTQGTPLL